MQLVSKIDVWLDGNGALKGSREGLGHFAIPCASVNEDRVCRQFVHKLLQPPLDVSLLIRVIEKDLEGLFICLSLRIKDANAFLVRHVGVPLWSLQKE